MSRPFWIGAVLLVALGLSSRAVLQAQEASPPSKIPLAGGESYGPEKNYLIISAMDFVPDDPSIPGTFDVKGYLTPTGPGTFRAAAPLPAGARVIDVCGFFYDATPSVSAGLVWWAAEAGGDGVPPRYKQLAAGGTGVSETPGYTVTCLGRDSQTLIRKFQDLDGDGHANFTWYGVEAILLSGNVGFGGVVITWARTISEPPATATFGDVPTNYIYFKAIEALAASGITQSCGNGNFCPTQNVTRGEMAAFLARALGLHWPL